MAEAKQMSLFGVDQPREDDLEQKYTALLANLREWQPKQTPRRGLYGIRYEQFTTLTVQEILKSTGKTCTFLEARELLKRLVAEGRAPEVKE